MIRLINGIKLFFLLFSGITYAMIADPIQLLNTPSESNLLIQNSDKLVMSILSNPENILFNVFPGGPTYLIFSKESISRELYTTIDAKILKLGTENKIPQFQQGGFIEKSNYQNTLLRLQMAYGELCINGLRALGTLIAQDICNKGNLFYREDSNYLILRIKDKEDDNWNFSIPLETSGILTPLTVHIKIKEKESFGWAGISLPVSNFNPVRNITLIKESTSFVAHLVHLEGISHLIIDSTQNAFPGAPAVYPFVLERAQEFLHTHQGVFGVIWLTRKKDIEKIKMDPIVCLTTQPPQFFYEQSCGSGAIASGMALAHLDNKEGNYRYEFDPPSTVPLIVSGSRESQTGSFTVNYLEGPVYLPGSISLDL